MYPECNTHVLLVATLGYVVLFFFLLSALWSVLQAIRAILAPLFLPHEETSLPKKYGPWALITGCTDGIGKAYTVELAKRGLNIVLVSRNQDKLQETARMLEIEYTVKTKIIQTDFSLGADAINVIKKQIGLLDIGILVNNVGKQYEYPMYLAEVSEKDLWDMITINVGAVTLLCRLLVDGMKKRGRGAIVNISSGSELQPLPLMTVYAATKVYIRHFTSALRYEYGSSGLTIQHLSPMFVNTKMNKFSQRLQKSNLFVPNSATYAKYAVATLGKMDESTGFPLHGIQYFLTSIVPVWMRTQIGGYMNKSFRQEYFKHHSETDTCLKHN